MKIEAQFRATYKAEVASELPASGHGIHYFPPVDHGIRESYEESLKFTPQRGSPWWGVFGTRSRKERGVSIGCTMPNPESFLVCCYGTGYIVNVEEPEKWSNVNLHPVLRVISVSDCQLLLANSFTRVIAYDAEGQKWRTESLFSDQLRIKGVTKNFVECTGWDAPSDEEVVRRVDIVTGNLI